MVRTDGESDLPEPVDAEVRVARVEVTISVRRDGDGGVPPTSDTAKILICFGHSCTSATITRRRNPGGRRSPAVHRSRRMSGNDAPSAIEITYTQSWRHGTQITGPSYEAPNRDR